MIWFPFYSSDFIGATVGLSCLERSLYALMLPLYYEVGPFPVERVRVYRIVGCESDEQKRAVDYLLTSFFVLRDDGWYQPRAEKEKVRWAQISQTARVKANKRWHGAPHDAAAMPQHSGSSAVAMPSTPTPTSTATTRTTPTPKGKEKTSALGTPSDVDRQVWDDWRALRRAKKAAVTDTAVAGIRRESAKVGMTLEDAMRMCCERGWAGFKAEWVDKQAAAVDKYAAQAERVIKLLDGETFDAKQ